MKLARSGTDQVYKQNLAITFGTNMVSDLMFIPYVGDILGKGVAKTTAKSGKYILDPVMFCWRRCNRICRETTIQAHT